jgi:Ser/Thr protein kinase RdoA (MazF antagonist)
MESFFNLQPDRILEFVEAAGFLTTAQLLQLNSYENRVFEIGIEDTSSQFSQLNFSRSNSESAKVIAKFYRPNRWSLEAIQEEHSFLSELQQDGVPAVAPLILNNDSTLLNCQGIYMALFPKVLGRMPQEFLNGELQQVGRRLAQIHNVGAKYQALYRPTLGTGYYGGWKTLELLSDWVSPELWVRYDEAAQHILNCVDDSIINKKIFSRIHGDCHKGNLLHNGKEFFFVDFDDCCTGPAVQDFWMLTSGDEESLFERDEILTGYEELRSFDDKEWDLLPLLKGLRLIGYAGWIAQRWHDPSFPRLFPEYNTYKYWAEETESLEKIAWQI